MMKHLCPCCGKHCYLDEPRCERGAEYAKTGVIPPRIPKPDNKGGVKKPSERMMMYRKLERDDKLIWNLRDMGKIIGDVAKETDNQELEMFACLREEDKQDLLILLEKVIHSWRHQYGKKEHEKSKDER